MNLSSALAVQILPTTILYDGQGKEVWRYVGDMDWTSAEAAKLLAEVG
jgi:thioredoxin-related protein